jgi:hypothetical protein
MYRVLSYYKRIPRHPSAMRCVRFKRQGGDDLFDKFFHTTYNIYDNYRGNGIGLKHVSMYLTDTLEGYVVIHYTYNDVFNISVHRVVRDNRYTLRHRHESVKKLKRQYGRVATT